VGTRVRTSLPAELLLAAALRRYKLARVQPTAAVGVLTASDLAAVVPISAGWLVLVGSAVPPFADWKPLAAKKRRGANPVGVLTTKGATIVPWEITEPGPVETHHAHRVQG
jgi:hypothetical protein